MHLICYKNVVLIDTTLLEIYGSFGRTLCFHLQCKRVKKKQATDKGYHVVQGRINVHTHLCHNLKPNML
jgi:hypothetical protein